MSGGVNKATRAHSKRDRMVTKRIRSEYMKKFKDPKWETYTRCYEEMLKYRLSRRLLEHTHSPWFWSGSDSDSDNGGGAATPPGRSHVRPEAQGDRTGQAAEGEGVRTDRQQRQHETPSKTTVMVPKIPLPVEEDNVSSRIPAEHGAEDEGEGETRAPEEEREEDEQGEEEEQRASRKGSKHLISQKEQEQERDRGAGHRQQTKTSKGSRPSWRASRVRPAPLQVPREDNKESRHPFALYGCGERDADMAARKTHNVGPAASTTEIHESALRAKTRREVERQIQTQRAERRRAKSADVDKSRTKLTQPEFNPWLTEYMRCFSARSR
ncbi:centriole, cilia and spindle-associated protein [Myripristis murdjan]|uniref:Centriole, cilia and spindle-associated protein b n=1 Tax=Myripristis murdjan TaxID=586833 RepID=A0A667ZZ42_9TELE|nr:centriole, cilia and spindle-associated protein [Myripristis murdjan]XP_029903200.1 centriole, cilia and spindle-associated protein [Myripristis murdjan]XP_029903209.1 centriole, cilia and spindle-associated protein [Myripristis murdjan]